MNPFEHAREKAQEVRCLLLKKRAPHAAPATELIAAIETELNLAIERVDPGYIALAGSTAALKRDERFIYVSDAIDADKFAALVGHELGHWYLDADKAPTTLTHLKSVTGGTGSPAVVKVEAYGARERQELQANVFSRELLAPRALMSKLYGRGLGPRQVASDLGVPIEYVRQQMLDALLLPKAAPTGMKPLHPASEDQEAAAHAAERFANVVAGPGTGKTSTLIHRVKFLIEERKVDPAHILVVTFTNKAAFELVERLKGAGIARAADIWAGTFHAFGLEFLRKYHQRFGLEPDLNVADLLNAVTMLSAALPGIPLKHYLRVQDPYDWLFPIFRGIKRLKEELISSAEYRKRLPTLAADSDEVRARREELATLYEAYEALLAKAKMVDFVDLVAKPALAIAADRSPYSELADRFQYILVDEYQDVTRAMIELMRQLARKKESLWVVGDVRQAIHHWRGASVKSLIRFDSTFKDEAGSSKIRRYPLTRNRRSSQEILDLIEQAGKLHVLESSLPLDKMSAERGRAGIRPGVVTSSLRADIPAALHSGIVSCHEAGVAFAEQVVLCRSAAAREPLARSLAAHGIPVLFIGELAQRVEIKRLLCLMQLLTERQPKALLGLLTEPKLGLPKADIDILMAASKELRWQRGRWLADPPQGLSVVGLKVIQTLRELLHGQSRHSNPWTFVCDLLLERRFQLPAQSDTSIPAWMMRIALWQFAYSVRNGDGEIKEARLPRFLMRQRLRQRLGETYADRELPPEAAALDAVPVLTIHGSKGLEYEAVHLAYVTDGAFGQSKQAWHNAESILDLVPPEVLGSDGNEYDFEEAVERNNLFYVAVSRAKRYLWLYDDDEYGDSDRASQLKHYPPRYLQCRFTPPTSTSVARPPPPVSLPPLGPLEFDRFEVYARCPLQFAYRYELKLRREEDTEPALRARWAIMNALREVAQGGEEPPDTHLAASWMQQVLPEPSLDPSLWNDAQVVFNRGLSHIAAFRAASGNYCEPTTTVAGLSIVLPWGFSVAERYQTTFHVLRFSQYGLSETATLLRPALAGMPGQGVRALTLHSLLPENSVNVVPAKAILKTNGAKAAIQYQERNRDARPGRPCARCAFVTICPLTPEAAAARKAVRTPPIPRPDFPPRLD
jgi:superfamily I DNA/RNA helicase